MRRTFIVAGLALALSAAAPLAVSHAAASHDQVTGTGTLAGFGDPTAHVNANQTPAGLKGSFTITYPDTTSVTGVPACLSVSGNTAYVIGAITAASGPRQVGNNWFPGGFLIIGVQDNGEPGTAGPDLLNFSPGFDTQPECAPNHTATPVLPIVAGNYHVVDAG
jgi:hypothetical protein